MSGEIISLPEEALDRARALEDAGGLVNWERGDLVNDLLDEMNPLVDGERDPEKPSERQIAATLAYESGGSGDTYRDCARVSRRVAPDLRRTWDALSWSQWRAALRWPDLDQAIVFITETYPEKNGGRLATVDAIIAYSGQVIGGIPWAGRLRSFQRAADKLAADSRVHPKLRRVTEAFLRWIDRQDWSE